MNIPKIYRMLFMALACQGCITEIPLPNEAQVYLGPVVHLYIQADSVIVADCSEVASIIGTVKPETAAQMTLYTKHNGKKNFIQSIPGRYLYTGQPLKARDSFWMDYQKATISFSIAGLVPSNIALIGVDSLLKTIPGIGPTQAYVVHFKDSAIDKNYYRLESYRQVKRYIRNTTGQVIDSSILWELMKIDGTSLPFLRNNYNVYTDKEILFTDETFNGVQSNLTVYNLLPFSNGLNEKTLAVKLILENLSLPLYQYYNSRAAHLWQQKSITQLPMPQNGNIPNGYGVLGAFTKVEWIVNY
ncbi:MAG: DUF4249 family protein [Bacteroidetes bacterium]|nr:DUF4249 family protein [Bacteroidota bacterium]